MSVCIAQTRLLLSTDCVGSGAAVGPHFSNVWQPSTPSEWRRFRLLFPSSPLGSFCSAFLGVWSDLAKPVSKGNPHHSSLSARDADIVVPHELDKFCSDSFLCSECLNLQPPSPSRLPILRIDVGELLRTEIGRAITHVLNHFENKKKRSAHVTVHISDVRCSVVER